MAAPPYHLRVRSFMEYNSGGASGLTFNELMSATGTVPGLALAAVLTGAAPAGEHGRTFKALRVCRSAGATRLSIVTDDGGGAPLCQNVVILVFSEAGTALFNTALGTDLSLPATPYVDPSALLTAAWPVDFEASGFYITTLDDQIASLNANQFLDLQVCEDSNGLPRYFLAISII